MALYLLLVLLLSHSATAVRLSPGNGPNLLGNISIPERLAKNGAQFASLFHNDRFLVVTWQSDENTHLGVTVHTYNASLSHVVSEVWFTSENIVPAGTFSVSSSSLLFAATEYFGTTSLTTFYLLDVPSSGKLAIKLSSQLWLEGGSSYAMLADEAGGSPPSAVGDTVYGVAVTSTALVMLSLNLTTLEASLGPAVKEVPNSEFAWGTSALNSYMAIQFSNGQESFFQFFSLPGYQLVSSHTTPNDSFFFWVSDESLLVIECTNLNSSSFYTVQVSNWSTTSNVAVYPYGCPKNEPWPGRYAKDLSAVVMVFPSPQAQLLQVTLTTGSASPVFASAPIQLSSRALTLAVGINHAMVGTWYTSPAFALYSIA